MEKATDYQFQLPVEVWSAILKEINDLKTCWSALRVCRDFYAILYSHLAVLASNRDLRVCVLGHIDAGKKTLLGSLLTQLGYVSPKTLAEMSEKGLAQINQRHANKYQLLMEHLLRIDIKTTSPTPRAFSTHLDEFQKIHFYLNYDKRDKFKHIKIVHQNPQADVAIIVIGAALGDFEAAICKTGLARSHLKQCQMLNMNNIVVAVTKLDDRSIGQSGGTIHARYTEIVAEMTHIVKRMQWTNVNLSFVPVNPVTDVNILTRVKYNVPGAGDESISAWYNGPALVEVLQQQRRESVVNVDVPARFVIHKVVGVDHVIGEVKSGILKSTDMLGYGDGKQLQIVSMHKNYQKLTRVMPGSADIELKFDSGMTQLVWRNKIKNFALLGPGLKYIKNFKAQIYIVSHPGQIHSGYTPVFELCGGRVACRIEILSKNGATSNDMVDNKPVSIKQDDSAMIQATPYKPICLEAASEYPNMASFTIRDLMTIVGFGSIISINY